MKTYTVECTERCSTCQGSGVLSNPNWTRFFAETKNQPEVDVDAWAMANGFRNAQHMGSEKEGCADCDGAGVFSKTVSLIDALRDLGVAVPSQA